MPAVLRRINRIFRRSSRELNHLNADDDPNADADGHSNNRAVRRAHSRSHSHAHPFDGMNVDSIPIQLRSTGYQRQSDGSVTLSVTLDKDQVECCVCLCSMTGKIYRCRGSQSAANSAALDDADNAQPAAKNKAVCHNVCSKCQWQMRRMKSGNGHTKEMQCPICKVKGPFVRNLALERQLLELSVRCSNSKHGCAARFFPWDDARLVHEKHMCVFQPVDCPFCFQTVPGGRVNFVEHLVKSTIARRHSPAQSLSLDEDHDVGAEVDEEDGLDVDEDDEDDEDEAIDDEEEEKEAPNAEADDADAVMLDDDGANLNSNDQRNKEADQVPACAMPWFEASADAEHSERSIVGGADDGVTGRNQFVVSYKLGMVALFVAPDADCPCWKVSAVSISPRHGTGGNSRVYLQYFVDAEMRAFVEKEQSMGLVTQSLCRPVTATLVLTLGRLHPTSLRQRFRSYHQPRAQRRSVRKEKSAEPELAEETKEDEEDEEHAPATSTMAMVPTQEVTSTAMVEDDESEDVRGGDDEISELDEFAPAPFSGASPCSPIQNACVWLESAAQSLCVRLFTLEQSFKVGAVIDARDFTGKWYQSEVIAVQDADGAQYDNLDHDNDDFLEVRRAKIHYLGYSQNYDEWLCVDTDSHRIAQRGTFTLGPDLRAIRRNTSNLHGHAHSGHHPHPHPRPAMPIDMRRSARGGPD